MGLDEDLQGLERRVEAGDDSDRWAAAAQLSEYVADHPDRIWPMVLRLASSQKDDVRQAVATNVLEHILEHHFDKFFPLIEADVQRGNENLRDSLRLCWKFGQSLDRSRSKRWDRLVERTGDD